MSIPERLFKISKAYLNQVRDRIDSELSDAERELNGSTNHGIASSGNGNGSDSSARASSEADAETLMQRAEAKIASAWKELEARQEITAARESEAAGSEAPSARTTRPTGTPARVTPAAGTSATDATGAVTEDPNASDYRVLDLPVGSDLALVQSTYERLAWRCDPRRFPEGSSEQATAARILGRVNVAYESLRKRLDPTVNRFGKLELE